jgi:hypothetical protein
MDWVRLTNLAASFGAGIEEACWREEVWMDSDPLGWLRLKDLRIDKANHRGHTLTEPIPVHRTEIDSMLRWSIVYQVVSELVDPPAYYC